MLIKHHLPSTTEVNDVDGFFGPQNTLPGGLTRNSTNGFSDPQGSKRKKKQPNEGHLKNGHPKLGSSPNQRSCLEDYPVFSLRGIYPFGFTFRGVSYQKQKTKIDPTSPCQLPPPNFSVAKQLATSTQHRLRLRTPRRITCQLPEKAVGSMMIKHIKHDESRNVLFCVNIWKTPNLVGGFNQSIWKKCSSTWTWILSPRIGAKIQNYLQPPPRIMWWLPTWMLDFLWFSCR